MSLTASKPHPRKRGSYGRPCDRCALRRVRCVTEPNVLQCIGCISVGLPCTWDRVRRKLGPKKQKRVPGPPGPLPMPGPVPASMLPPFGTPDWASLPSIPLPLDLRPGNGDPHGRRDVFPPPHPEMRPPDPPYLGRDPHLGRDPPHMNRDPPHLNRDPPHLGRDRVPGLPETPDYAAYFQHGPPQCTARLLVEHLLLRLQVYQTWFYGYWPVLLVADLVSVVLNGATIGYERSAIVLTEKNAMAYALCCAVCAAITTQISFVTSSPTPSDPNTISADEYAREAIRARNLFEYTRHPSVDTLLLLFFLYAHYINIKSNTTQAIVFLREAILLAQILRFHEKSSYADRSRAEIHRWRKIYYTLLVTERYTCFEDGLPVILDPCVDFPDLDDEEYPNLLHGFTELIRVFSVPSKKFFLEMNIARLENSDIKLSIHEKRQWILAVQDKLTRSMDLLPNILTSQKLNIILSKSWIRAIACHITSDNGMLRLLDDQNDCFSFNFPLRNAREFLLQTHDLPDMAFETNGPGVCIKLLEMAKSLSYTLQKSLDRMGSLDVMNALFSLVNKYKNDVSLPIPVYQEIAEVISLAKIREAPRIISSTGLNKFQQGTIEELFDDEESKAAHDTQEPHDDFLARTPLTVDLPNALSIYGRYNLGALPGEFGQAVEDLRVYGKFPLLDSDLLEFGGMLAGADPNRSLDLFQE